MAKRKDLLGKRFGRLKVIAYSHTGVRSESWWKCLCSCKTIKNIRSCHLSRGSIKSCGCIVRTHGDSKTAFFNVWSSMLKRCFLKSRKDYFRYGGRNIKPCRAWMKYPNFKKDMFTSYLAAKSEYRIVLLDRIDNDKGYTPSNCRWVNPKVSCENRSSTHWITFDNKKQTLVSWAREIGISSSSLKTRLKRWGIERALLTPKREKRI